LLGLDSLSRDSSSRYNELERQIAILQEQLHEVAEISNRRGMATLALVRVAFHLVVFGMASWRIHRVKDGCKSLKKRVSAMLDMLDGLGMKWLPSMFRLEVGRAEILLH